MGTWGENHLVKLSVFLWITTSVAEGEGSRVEEKYYIESRILAKLMQSKRRAGGLPYQPLVIGQVEDLYRRG